MLFSTLLTLAVVGCTPKGNTDGDGDGHFADTAGGDDCDDTNGTVHPGATETCNGIDDNCDSHVDEALGSPYYADADGDTFGDLAVTQTACTAPEGYVSDSTDCQDDEAAAFPGADEQCDGIDNNCDGSVDEPTATGATEWYPDGDEDGYGDPEDGEVGCTAPADMIAQGGDCDDDDAARNPGAEEVCNTVDDNCDGTTDGADEVGSPLWYLDSDGDQFGDATVEQAACTRPDGYVQDHTDCDDAVATTNPSAAEYCNGADDNCDAVVDEATAVDASVWYADADSDSHGDPFLYQTACSEPLGYVADYTDCDDADPQRDGGLRLHTHDRRPRAHRRTLHVLDRRLTVGRHRLPDVRLLVRHHQHSGLGIVHQRSGADHRVHRGHGRAGPHLLRRRTRPLPRHPDSGRRVRHPGLQRTEPVRVGVQRNLLPVLTQLQRRPDTPPTSTGSRASQARAHATGTAAAPISPNPASIPASDGSPAVARGSPRSPAMSTTNAAPSPHGPPMSDSAPTSESAPPATARSTRRSATACTACARAFAPPSAPSHQLPLSPRKSCWAEA
ncbi:MAG: hypothetical protein EXR69_05550 [Myxococcales bacterium]|nr:hypothetical protein [Myxococcales bacterium]